MEEQFSKEAKEGWRLAADAARITDESTGSEDRKHTSGGVFVAVDSNLGVVVGAEEGTIDSISCNGGRIAQTWVNVRGGTVFSCFFLALRRLDPEKRSPAGGSSEASKNNQTPVVDSAWCKHVFRRFEKSLWFQREQMHVVAPKEASTCRSKGP